MCEMHKTWCKHNTEQTAQARHRAAATANNQLEHLDTAIQNKLNNDGFQNPKLDNTLNKGQKTVAFASQNESISAKDSRNDSVV